MSRAASQDHLVKSFALVAGTSLLQSCVALSHQSNAHRQLLEFLHQSELSTLATDHLQVERAIVVVFVANSQ